uniref:Uncharacterized protein n=1 Tax=Arundo donax TaxID=35708 RepID=A0A0A9BED4_ARUDO
MRLFTVWQPTGWSVTVVYFSLVASFVGMHYLCLNGSKYTTSSLVMYLPGGGVTLSSCMPRIIRRRIWQQIITLNVMIIFLCSFSVLLRLD